MSLKAHLRYINKISIFSIAFIFVVTSRGFSQSSGNGKLGYRLIPKPDLWYNSVDGVRVGLRLKGEVPGTFNEGPHQLNLGIWGGSKLPSDPVSYYLTFKEPIKALTKFGSPADVQLVSSIRTGYIVQGLSFSKRWQIGFNHDDYRRINISADVQKMNNKRYRLFPFLWSENWISLATVTLKTKNKNGLGKYYYRLSLNTGLPVKTHFFERFSGSFEQSIKIGSGFVLHGRIFAGLSSKDVPLQMRFNRSLASPVDWLNNGLSRARGTIPPLWLKEGWLQITGGPSLRGYTKQDMQKLFSKEKDLNLNFASVNLEMDYPNPIDTKIKKIPVIGDLIKMRSYLFFDSGSPLRFSNNPLIKKIDSDAGPGFAVAISIPDNKGYMKNIVLRYDIPLWLSHPGMGQKALHYRSIIGLSTIIKL